MSQARPVPRWRSLARGPGDRAGLIQAGGSVCCSSQECLGSVFVGSPGELSARSEQTLIGAERQQLEAFLDDNRSELAGALTGLTEQQARRRLVPSLTTLLGLVKHAAWVERVWFQASLLGHSRGELGIAQHV